MNIKRLIVGVSTGALLVSAFSFTAFAAPKLHLDSKGQLNPQACDVEGNLAINIVGKVLNAPDFGLSGVWAVDNYTRLIKVWPIADGKWCATVKYEGEFNTITDAMSPNDLGQQMGESVRGELKGGYNVVFPGTLKTIDLPQTFGEVETVDYGCTADGQNCSQDVETWFTKYFDGVDPNSRSMTYNLDIKWIGWIYKAQDDRGTWLNGNDSSEGNIF